MNNIERKFRFRKFPVYIEARIFIRETKSIAYKNFPRKEQFSLLSQLSRALDSIILNIAEGSDRGTDRDFAHYLNISNTSLNEVVACMDVAFDEKYISHNEHSIFLESAAKLANQLTAFRNSLIKNPLK